MSITSSSIFINNLKQIIAQYSIVSIDEFEQVNGSWE